jgi:hypothetical protein
VFNKCDLPAASGWCRPAGLIVSARTGAGLEALVAALAARLVPEPPPAGQPIPFRRSQVAACDFAIQAVDAGQIALARRALTELMVDRSAAAAEP